MSKRLILTVLSSLSLLLSPLLSANPMRPDPLPTVTAPVKTVAVVKAAPRLPQLEQIIIIGDYRLATFNGGQDVLLGESIAGYLVSEIQADHVIVVRNRKATRINLDQAGRVSITPVTEE